MNIGTSGSFVAVRFTVGSALRCAIAVLTTCPQSDNPGPWFLHCHIDFHLAAGFAVVMAEDPMDVPGYVRPVPRKLLRLALYLPSRSLLTPCPSRLGEALSDL